LESALLKVAQPENATLPREVSMPYNQDKPWDEQEWTPEELEKGKRFVKRVEQARKLYAERKRKEEFEAWKSNLESRARLAGTKKGE
jgi:hypothetical protein